MNQGYARGVIAARISTAGPEVSTASLQAALVNPYPKWCREYQRFEAGRSGQPDPDLPSQPALL